MLSALGETFTYLKFYGLQRLKKNAVYGNLSFLPI